MIVSLCNLAAALLLSPLLIGIINRVKALFGGRNGQPLLQPYYDLYKLLHKGAVYSRTATWIFRAYPAIALAAMLAAFTLVPLGGHPALVSGRGDLFLFAYLLGLMRFFNIIAALDTGSSFEGMGASREAQFSALAEIAFLLGLSALACATDSLSLSEIYGNIHFPLWAQYGSALLLVAVAFLIVFLAENARIPVDDPNTHLELTMIHEVMILDYSGPDFAMLLYAAGLKLWIFGSLLIGVLLPLHSGNAWLDSLAGVGGTMLLAVFVGIIESTMARLRLLRVPQLLAGAGVFSTLALLFILR